jgi:hypothetical protein
MTTTPATYTVKTHGDDPNGVANILTMLLTQNFAAKPELIAVAKKMKRPVAIVSTDTDTQATVDFGRDGVTVYNGVMGDPSVVVYGTVDQILDVSQLKMKAGGLLPVGFFSKRGGKVLGQIVTHKLVVKGLLSHTVSSLRTIALVSVAD